MDSNSCRGTTFCTENLGGADKSSIEMKFFHIKLKIQPFNSFFSILFIVIKEINLW